MVSIMLIEPLNRPYNYIFSLYLSFFLLMKRYILLAYFKSEYADIFSYPELCGYFEGILTTSPGIELPINN